MTKPAHNKQFEGEHALVPYFDRVPASIKPEIRALIKRRKEEIKQQIKNETK